MRGELDYKRVTLSCAAVGLAVGIICSLPIIRLLCCLWLLIGGFAAVYFASREVKAIEPVEAAMMGGLFGLVYGITVNLATFFINIPLNLLGLGVLARGLGGGGFLGTLGIGLGFKMLTSLLVILLNIVIGVIFGALGGILFAVTGDSDEQGSRPQGIAPAMPKKSALGRR